MTNLFDALNEEISRNESLLRDYREIPTGGFGAMFIDRDLKIAKKARADGDVVAMMPAYEALKGNK